MWKRAVPEMVHSRLFEGLTLFSHGYDIVLLGGSYRESNLDLLFIINYLYPGMSFLHPGDDI